MKVCIHRGTHQIGGTCVEIESQGKRIVLDVGLPLDAEPADMPLPPVPGIDWSPELRDSYDRALLALGRLDSVAMLLPETSLFIYSPGYALDRTRH